MTATDILRRNNISVTGNAQGRTPVLAHGFGCDQAMWRLTVPALTLSEDRYASLAGYAQDAVDVRSTRPARCGVRGTAVSAMIGVLAADMAPERIAALAMMGPSPRHIDDGYRGGFSAEDIEELLASLEVNYLGRSAAMAPVVMGNPEQPELGEELKNSFCATDPDMARIFARTTFLSDSRRDLKSVRVPTLVLECTQDVIAPREVGAFVHQEIPGSTLVTLEATGHCPHRSAPEATNEALTGFLADLR
ncbi:alpha/beta fold hydrolase [Streptomyces collinus]|uniref:alpha/beta fold hydrolase n=1 Tax=Streptomyces collinus TaxID=42684 RepID=UPI0036CC59F4